MMKDHNLSVEITPIHPENIRFLSSKTIEYLKSASNPYFGPFEALDKAKENHGTIFEIRAEEELVGAFYLRFLHNHLGKVMDLVYLGGELEKFRNELSAFLWNLGETERVDEFTYLSPRAGFARLFPWMEPVSTLYHCSKNANQKSRLA